MRERGGMSRLQIIFIVLLWMGLCVLLFVMASDKSIAERIIYAIASGILIYVGVSAGQRKVRNTEREKKRNRRR